MINHVPSRYTARSCLSVPIVIAGRQDILRQASPPGRRYSSIRRAKNKPCAVPVNRYVCLPIPRMFVATNGLHAEVFRKLLSKES
jgi:hypothetical protein